jgi:DNA polymerase I
MIFGSFSFIAIILGKMNKTLLLVDASSYLYRAYHALPDLRNSKGEMTNAIYGVLSMLRKLRHDFPAEYIACVFDAKGKTFRDDLYPEYKANRAAMPDDLRDQIAPLHDAIRAMGWPLLAVEGVEADDVIGTLAKHAEARGVHTVISTGDKDIAQLVNPHVVLVNTMSNEKLDEAGVQTKFGIPANRMIDYLTLMGDAVDNVPGVEKVGPKTAVKWLTEYDSLANIVANADKIKGVVGDNLRKALDWLPKGRELITIKCDVALPVEFDTLVATAPDKQILETLFERFEFKTWLRELKAGVDPNGKPGANKTQFNAPAEKNGGRDFAATDIAAPIVNEAPKYPRHYETILTQVQFDDWLAKLNAAPLACIDTETTGLDPLQAQIVGLSLCVEPGCAAYLPLMHRYAGAPEQLSLNTVLAALKPYLENPNKNKVGQNLKYDMHVLANHGIALKGVAHDTLLQSYVLESHLRHDMDTLALRHLNAKTILFEDVAGKGAGQIGFDQVGIEQAAEYAAEDADITLQLHQHLQPQIAADKKLDFIYREIEMPSMHVLWRIERNGVLLDVKLLETQSRELGEKLIQLEAKAHEEAGQPFNLNSPKQLQEILFEKMKIPVVKKTPGGQPSTDEDVLQQLAQDHPLPKLLLEYRGLAKLKSTYTDKLPRMVNPNTGRVHTNYGQAIAVTGRLASNDPNLQNIPVRTAEGRRIREAFIAPPGSQIISADYSQIELRIMAHLSGDEGFLKAFAAGEDIHRATAAEIFGVELNDVTSEQRRYAKVINFGLIYGMSAFGLAGNLGIERSAAASYIERYFARYPGVAKYMERTRNEARDQGYVETVFGRRLFLPEIRNSNAQRRQGAERAAINAPMQGTAADLIKLAMIAVDKWLTEKKLNTKLIMQVHDELVLEVPDDEIELVKKELPPLMCNVAKLAVPLLVEAGVGPNWEKAH